MDDEAHMVHAYICHGLGLIGIATMISLFPMEAKSYHRTSASRRANIGNPAIPTASMWPFLLQAHENKVYSQNGEDGILEFIFQNIGTTNKYYVEFGVEDGHECNTRYLREKLNFHGLLMDSGAPNSDINLQQEFIKTSTIRSLFEKYEVPREPDLLSIDIDSTDLWIWRKLCGGKQPYRPRVVVLEYNMNYAMYEYWTNPDDPTVFWEADGMFGASLSALHLAGRQLGYTLIYTDKNSVNAFFLRDDLPGVEQYRSMLPLEAIHRPARPLHAPMSPQRRAKLVDYRIWCTINDIPVSF